MKGWLWDCGSSGLWKSLKLSRAHKTPKTRLKLKLYVKSGELQEVYESSALGEKLSGQQTTLHGGTDAALFVC